jgi:hypothetical protein
VPNDRSISSDDCYVPMFRTGCMGQTRNRWVLGENHSIAELPWSVKQGGACGPVRERSDLPIICLRIFLLSLASVT